MMRRFNFLHTALFAVVLASASVAGGQTVPAPQASVAQAPDARRMELEQRLRERTGEVVRRRLALNDDQMMKLQATNRRFEGQRTDLLLREKETRQALRAELVLGDAANQSKVGQLLDQQLQLQRQRIDLIQSEQRELGNFLTPVQRAKYFGLQNEIRKRAQTLRAAQAQNGDAIGGINGPASRPLVAARRQARRVLKQQ